MSEPDRIIAIAARANPVRTRTAVGVHHGNLRHDAGVGNTAGPAQRKPRILYIHPDTMGLPEDPEENAFHHLSSVLQGDYLAVWWGPADRAARAEAAARIRNACGDFGFHWNRSHRLPQGMRHIRDLLFFVGKGLTLRVRRGRYDAIVAYGPYRTGLAAYILKRLIGAKLILELPGNPAKSLDFEGGLINGIKRRLGPLLVKFLVPRADHLWLRYPTQLGEATPADPARTSVFPSFVPVAALGPRTNESGPFVFFLGHPWSLKGVDILIRAFRRISPRHPEVRLVVMGHCPDRTPFLRLAGNDPRIEFYPGTPHPEAMKVMARCTVFVLPSRTDAMARVLIEAMACAKPIVASRVDGTPFYVKDGERGLLFASESVDELARLLDRVLSDAHLAATLGRNGQAYVRQHLAATNYVDHFRSMIERTIGRDSGAASFRPEAEARGRPAAASPAIEH